MPSVQYVDTTAVNGTTYYYVVSSTNACGESAGNSIESHATPLAPFSYAPATSIIIWSDTNGAGQTGNLAFFNAHADFASVSFVNLSTQGITAVSNLNALPALSTLYLWTNSLTALDVSGCTALATLSCYSNPMTTLNITGCAAMLTLYPSFCNLTVLSVNTILTNLVSNGQAGGTFDCHAQTPAAPPDAGPPNGIVAKAALLAAGWTVTTD